MLRLGVVRGALRHSNYDVKPKGNKIEKNKSGTEVQRERKVENTMLAKKIIWNKQREENKD